ncbi:MAG: hypothetical protein IDH49_03730 [Gammaproteobacteria bacterium]|nr:hypothetical protein [Gammaproteobacteria bacterium]
MNSYNRFSYPTFDQLPQALKVLYTMVLLILGLGYIFAMIQIYEVHSGRDGRPGLSVEDIRIAYSGSKTDTRLEAALKGPMAGMLPGEERAQIIAWVRDGGKEDAFGQAVQPILQNRCLGCHNGSNPHIPSLTNYQEVKNLAQLDTGMSIGTLVRVSHIHLFGLTFIFAFTGLIFSHAYVRRKYLKSIAVAMPFVAIFLDIMSWWLTKVSTPFAYVVFVGGALMGLSFAYQWFVSMYQLWFFKCPDDSVCIP